MSVPYVSEQEFERDVLRSELPVLVDFTAAWCGPCKTVAPEVDAVARELEGKVKVVKVDIDQSPRIAGALHVQAVPTFVVFKGGRPAAVQQGALRRAQLREMLEPFVPRAAGAIRAAELGPLVQQGRATPVDTREAAAHGRARIPGAVHVPLEALDERAAELAGLGGAPVLYCRSGDKSKVAAERLASAGTPVAFLEGGLLAWEAAGLAIERPD